MPNITPILDVVARARKRMLLGQLMGSLGRVTLWAGVALAVVSVATKIVAGWWSPAGERGIWFFVLVGVAMGGIALWSYLTRPNTQGDVAVASVIDVRLKLHDRLSTAVAVAERSDPFARAAIEDGLKIARDRRIMEALGRAIPIEAPRNWWAGPTLVIIACAVWWFVPGLSLGNAQASAAQSEGELQAARDAAKIQIDTLQAKIETNPELSKALGDGGDEKKLGGDLTDEKLQSPESVRRETTRQVNEVSKKLAEMAAQLNDAAKANDALKKALENAGLDGALAKNPQAAKAAIDAAKNLNEAQKKALKEAVQSQAKANEKLEKLANACESMSSQCKSGGKKSDNSEGKSSKSGEASEGSAAGSAEGANEAAEVLSEMETLNELMKDAESARSQCQSTGADPSEKLGSSGMNAGRGKGMLGERTKEKTDTATRTRKEKVQSTGGDVIARQLVEAPPVVGESRATLQQLSGEIGHGYEEGTEEDPVPANLRELHKHYFGDLKKKIDAKSGQAAPVTAPDAAPPQK